MIVLIFRVAIAVTPFVVRACASNACDANQWANAFARFQDRILNPDEDPDELSADMTADIAVETEGGSIHVTDFTGTFELRKLQWRLSRAPTGGTVEDQDVMTFHWIKATAGTPTTWVDGTDLPALETLVSNYWTALKPAYPTFMHSDQYRWYKDGPAFYELRSTPPPAVYVPLAAGNPAIRVTEVDVAGTGTGSTQVAPPQVAMSVTEKTSSRPHWGRWYLPAPLVTWLDNQGRIASSEVTNMLGYAVTFYNACRAAGYVPVVWSIQKPDRLRANGATLPAVGAAAYEVAALQMDNVADVIRRRRYDAPTVKLVTVLT